MAQNDWQQQVNMNGAVFATLLAGGEDMADERHVIHYFYDGDVEGLATALKDAGYEVRPSAVETGVIAECHAVTDETWSESEMKKVCDLANRFGAEYDGWEGSFVRSEGSN